MTMIRDFILSAIASYIILLVVVWYKDVYISFPTSWLMDQRMNHMFLSLFFALVFTLSRIAIGRYTDMIRRKNMIGGGKNP